MELNDGRISFFSRGEATGVNGQPVDDLIWVHTCWFNYRQQFIRERKEQQDTVFENTMDIFIRERQRVPIENDMLVTIDGMTYEILVINPDRNNKAYQVLTLKEVN
ncbi:phage head closure protein [Listeria sp. FSL L7-1582]|uniref:phage head closure protein n=1 Tax=Listeria portnoyi TaxID=2713504 RepID=UPI00164DFB32|nr:phage head closure protein [Listeria portnoyi]MBC6310147.1 phage head closure protein [Listeria portnoyi]